MKTIEIHEKGAAWVVSESGEIFTKDRTLTINRKRLNKNQQYQRTEKGIKLSPHLSQSGYLIVSQKANGKRPKVFVHRLIGMAFVDGYKPELSINHINGIKTDNRPENLEWVTLSENTKHQWSSNLVNLRGEDHPSHKLTQKQVIHIRKALQKGISANSLSIIANVSPSLIYLIEKGKRWASIVDNE
jgi:hypothetical protein